MSSFRRTAMRGCVVLCVCAAASPALAQTSADQDIGGVVFGAGRTPIASDRIGRATTVITAEELEQRQVRFVADALRTVPGAAVSRTGAPGGQTQVRIRGSEANHVLVLIDGVEASSPASGEFDFGGLLAADIERIEVLRGPQSALFGSNATAGVVNIITKRAETRGLTVGGSAETGTDETVAADAFSRWAGETAHFSVSGALRRSGGHDVSGDATDIEDQDRNATANVRLGVDPLEWLSFDGSLRVTDRRSDFDDFVFGAPTRSGLVVEGDFENDQREIFAGVGAAADGFGGRTLSRLRFGFTQVDQANRQDGARTSDSTGQRLQVTAQNTFALDAPTVAAADHKLTLAAEFERETFENNDAELVFDPSQLDTQTRNLYGFVGEYQGSFFDALDLQVAVRHDVNDDFEDATTYSASASYLVERTGTRPHASIGTGVTNPDFFQQFGFIPDTFVGNPSLDPERNFEWDVGVEQSVWSDRVILDVTYFRARLEDEIVTTFGPAPDFLATVENQDGTSERQGVEVSLLVTPLIGLDVTGAYTWTDADDPDGRIEVRRPRHQFGIAANYAFLDNRAQVGLDGRYVLGNTDFDFTEDGGGAPSRVNLDDYVLLNVTASYAVSENVTLQARVDNVLDTQYQEVDGFDTPGVAGFLGASVRF